MGNSGIGDAVGATTVVCDLDGVLFTGTEPIAGAGEALGRFDAAGFRVLFATNNSTRTLDQVVTTVAGRTGFEPDPETIVTSALATAHHLAGDVAAAYVIGGEGLRSALAGAGIVVDDTADDVDAVAIGLDRSITYQKLEDATLAVAAGARLVASNVDATFPSPRGLVPGAGSIVAALETATGRSAEVCGKPHRPMAELVVAKAAVGEIVMVGDRIETDIAFGAANGWRTILVLTGVTAPDRAPQSGADDVVDSIADVPALLGA